MGSISAGTIKHWNTFVGGAGNEHAVSIKVDGSGNTYLSGSSPTGWGFPVRMYSHDRDVFVAKLSAAGAVTWNTFLGGEGVDTWAHLVVTSSGIIYVIGESSSSWGEPIQAFTGTFTNVFIAKLDASGNLLWHTFLGSWDTLTGLSGSGIALDSSSNIFIVGDCDKRWGVPLRDFSGGPRDAFIAKFDSSGALQWNTFLGGAGADYGEGIVLDTNGMIYVTGNSLFGWGDPVRGFEDGTDVFAAQLDGSGNLNWNTFLGGKEYDGVSFNPIALDSSKNVYIAGSSNAVWGAPIRGFNDSGADAFAAKLNSSGALQWNTFLGGDSSSDLGNAIALDTYANVYVSGDSYVNWGSPILPYSARTDAFVARLDSLGNLQWNTFLGGDELEYGNAIAVTAGNIYAAGNSSGNWGDPIRYHQGGSDMFVAHIKNPLYTSALISRGEYDGWIVEYREHSDRGGRLDAKAATLRLGDDKLNNQYRSILSFRTGELPDNATITSVVLKIKQESVTGDATFDMFQGLRIAIKLGPFDLPSLQRKDFQTAPSAAAMGPFTPHDVGNWYTFNLTKLKAYINRVSTNSGVTQFRLYFELDDNNNMDANYISFYSGDSDSYKPVLAIQYTVP
jgi:hypothetical protein